MNQFRKSIGDLTPFIWGVVLITAIGGLPGKVCAGSALDKYVIEVELDYRAASFVAKERVRFTNRASEEVDSVLFVLYPNMGLTEEDTPWLQITQASMGDRQLRYSLRSRATILRVELGQKLAVGQSVELTVGFTGKLPKIQREESSLLAHFLQEVNDAVSDERQMKDARDIFFASEEAMLLGYFYPVLSPQRQAVEQTLAIGVGAIATSDAADYDVTLMTSEKALVVSSGTSVSMKEIQTATGATALEHRFRGEKLRGFALVLAERMRSSERLVGNVQVISSYRESDERLGKKALAIAAGAVESYSRAFGQYPLSQLQVIEMPLPAGYSGIEFPGVVIVAQAYFIDFDSSQSVRLPGVLREQADVIKSAFEFTLAHGVAKQWWGYVVGSDSERVPYQDEALATFSAAYYHEAQYGKPLGDLIIDQQLRGVYQAYRMLGGVDLEADKPAREYRNALQYTAVVQAKAGLMLVALRKEMGDRRFFEALRHYYERYRFQIASPENLRQAFFYAAEDPRVPRALFQRWLREKHGDEDIGAPDLTLSPPPVSKIRALGRVFVKIGKTAAKPF